MHSKVGMIGLVVIGLLLTWGAPSEAHGPIYSGGRLIHKSAHCVADYTSVANPTTVPQVSQCTLTATLTDSLCRNNGGQFAPGQIPRTIEVTGQTPITGNLVNKKKGTATVPTTVVPACLTNPPASDDPCLLGVTNVEACPNENWDLIAVLVREGTMAHTGFRCSDATCTTLIPTSVGEEFCVLPPEVDFFTPIPPEGIPYTCTLILKEHINH